MASIKLTVLQILLDDYEHYAINRAGLRTIINIRGGIETLDNFFEQRVFVIVYAPPSSIRQYTLTNLTALKYVAP